MASTLFYLSAVLAGFVRVEIKADTPFLIAPALPKILNKGPVSCFRMTFSKLNNKSNKVRVLERASDRESTCERMLCEEISMEERISSNLARNSGSLEFRVSRLASIALAVRRACQKKIAAVKVRTEKEMAIIVRLHSMDIFISPFIEMRSILSSPHCKP